MGDLIQSVSAAGAGAAVRYDNSALTAYLQQAATAGSTSINFGLKAGSESDKYQYKKVANNPLLTITYAFPVSAPRFTNITNTVTCDSALYVNTPTPTFSAAATDYNISPGNIRIDHQIRKSDNTIAAQGSRVEPSGVANTFTPATALAEGTYTYWARSAQTNDGYTYYSPWTSLKTFTVSTQQPAAVRVYTATHPAITFNTQGDPIITPYSSTQNGALKLSVIDDTNIAGYAYSWTNTPPVAAGKTCATPTQDGYIAATNGSATLPINPPPGQRHTLTIIAISKTGHPSTQPTTHAFNTTPATYTVSALEAENLPVTSTGDYSKEPSILLSNQSQIHFSPTQPGQSITFTFNLDTAGQWIIQPESSASRNYGIAQYAIDNQTITTPETDPNNAGQTIDVPLTVDHYSPTTHQFTYPLPAQNLTAGAHTLTITIIGKNPAATTWFNLYLNRQDSAMSYPLDQIRLIKTN